MRQSTPGRCRVERGRGGRGDALDVLLGEQGREEGRLPLGRRIGADLAAHTHEHLARARDHAHHALRVATRRRAEEQVGQGAAIGVGPHRHHHGLGARASGIGHVAALAGRVETSRRAEGGRQGQSRGVRQGRRVQGVLGAERQLGRRRQRAGTGRLLRSRRDVCRTGTGLRKQGGTQGSGTGSQGTQAADESTPSVRISVHVVSLVWRATITMKTSRGR